MKYRDILGYENEKSPTKEKKLKPKKNQILEGIKKDLNEWNDTTFRDKPKRWSNSNGLTEYEQELKEVSGVAEYRPHIKKIDKLYDTYLDSVKDFEKLLKKKGLKREALTISAYYNKLVGKFDTIFKKIVKKLL